MWRGDSPNFGDDLNGWLWSRLLPNFFDDDASDLFIGMGSILYPDYAANAMKHVVGSGYGGYTKPPVLDDHWTVYFVRGPLTARVLGVDEELGVGDPGTLVGAAERPGEFPRGTGGPAFMPHWESARDGMWPEVAAAAGIRYIDPRWPVDRVLTEIAASRVLVTEAMHGAIVADALRVPWVPFRPIGRHHFKWRDWAASLGIDVHFAKSAPSVWHEAALGFFDRDSAMQTRILHYSRNRDLKLGHALFRPGAIRAMSAAAKAEPHLSSDAAVSRASARMLERIERVRRAARRVCGPA